MGNDISIGRMSISDRDAVLEFLRSAYPDNPRQSDPEFWQWHFTHLPFESSSDPPVWLARSDSRIAGQLAAIPVRLKIDEAEVDSLWILDLMVHPDFRRRGLMKSLVRALYDRYPVLLGVSTPQQHSPVLLQSIGWKVVGKIPRYQKLLYPAHDLREIRTSAPLVSVVNALFAPFRPRIKKGPLEQGPLKGVDHIDERFEDVWRRLEGRCSVARTKAYLKWQFECQPGKEFQFLGYFQDTEMLGWAVMFFRKADERGRIAKAAITDVCYDPHAGHRVVDALIDGCIGLAIERRVGSLVTDVMDMTVQKRLRKKGFWRINSPLLLLAWSQDGQSPVLDADKWFLTRADADISIFEHPNL